MGREDKGGLRLLLQGEEQRNEFFACL